MQLLVKREIRSTTPIPIQYGYPVIKVQQFPFLTSLGPCFVKDAEPALPTPNRISSFDHISSPAIAASVLDTSQNGYRRRSFRNVGGSWSAHDSLLLVDVVIIMLMTVDGQSDCENDGTLVVDSVFGAKPVGIFGRLGSGM